MARSLFLAAVFSLLFSSMADAIGVAMLKDSCSSCEELARALEGHDLRGILHEGGLDYFFRAISSNYPEIGLKNPSDLPEYIRNLKVRPCPPGKFRLSTIILSSGELGEIIRSFRPGEMCLYDNNQGGIFLMSLTCGNVIIRPPEEVRQKPAEKPISSVPILPSTTQIVKMRDVSVSVGNKTVNNYNYGDASERRKKEEKKSSMAWWKKTLLWTGAAIVTGAVVALIYDEISEDNNNRSYNFVINNNPPPGGDPVQDIGGPVNPPNRLDPVPGGGPVNPGN